MLSLLLWYNRGDKNGGAAMCRFKFRLWNCLNYSQDGETAGLHEAVIYKMVVRLAVSRFKFRLWNCQCSARISRTAGLNKAVIADKRAATWRFKFRLWNCWCSAKIG